MWPDDGSRLPVQVEAAFGADVTADPGTWSWTDLSSRLEGAAGDLPIRIRSGRPASGSPVAPSSCTVNLDNADGALTPANPLSPYWPNVRLGTPLRVQVQVGGFWYERFAGFADQWQPTFLPTTEPGVVHSVARVTASGPLRRLGQGTPPARSALRRTIPATGPVAYWPIEDGLGSSSIASAIPGQEPVQITGTPEFGDPTKWEEFNARFNYGTAALVNLAEGARLSAPVSAAATAATQAGWTVAVLMQLGLSSSRASDVVAIEVDTPGGTYVKWRLIATPAGNPDFFRLVAYDASGASTVVFTDSSGYITLTVLNLAVWQDGANIRVGFQWDDPSYAKTATVAGTLRGATRVGVNTTGGTSGEPLLAGHIALWPGHGLPWVSQAPPYGAVWKASVGHEWQDFTADTADGEPAAERLARLCAEDGVPLVVDGSPDSAGVVRMGFQEPGTPLDLYRECEDADGGILAEQGFGLAYLPRADRYNRAMDLPVDLADYRVTSGGQAGVLTPIYDDQTIRNELTVSRRDGSSVVVADEASQQRHGVYADSVELNLVDDAQLADQASWRLHLAGGEV
ncbi:hypothetical protein ABZ814_13530 [Micromonospora musae]|uniref:hypothetical protein n=1 Tax=Micromonospora musae TaxID=1894970 RepID=UPI0033F86300